MFGWCGVFPGNQCKGAKPFKDNQYNDLKCNKPDTSPGPFVNPVCYYRVEEIEDDHIVKCPDEGMDRFYKCEFGSIVHVQSQKGSTIRGGRFMVCQNNQGDKVAARTARPHLSSAAFLLQ